MNSEEEQKQILEPVAMFELGDLLGIGMTIVVLVIGLAYGLQITGEVKDDMGVTNCASRTDDYTTYNSSSELCMNGTAVKGTHIVGTAEFNATNAGIDAVGKIPAKLGTIVTVVMAAVIIGILVRYLWVRFAS